MASARSVLSYTPLRPEPVLRLQEEYLATFGARLLATVVVLAVVAVGIGAVRWAQARIERRYGGQLAEAAAVAGFFALVFFGIYWLSVIWWVTSILRTALGAVVVNRWEAALILVSAGTIAVTYFGMRLVNRSIDKLSETKAITNHQSEVAYHVADVAIVGVAGTVLLSIWGIDLTNIFIGAGAITAIVALTARETLTSMLAGFILLFSRPFRVGEWIEVTDENETSGIVTDVTIFHTELQTFDDKQVLVPNDEITSSTLINYSRNDQLRLEIDVGVDYDTDIEHARRVALSAVEGIEAIKAVPEPQAVAKRFDESAIVLELQVWIADPTRRRSWDARTEAIEAITAAFDREGITIPFPQRVHSPREGAEFAVGSERLEEPTPSTDD